MKSRYLIMLMLIATILTGCHKDSQIDPKTPSVTNQTVEVSATAATFRWTVDWLGKFASVVEVSGNEDMSDSQTFGSETETTDHSFTATATGLKEATGYYYRFLVWNKGFVDKKFKTEVKSFTTKSDVPKVKTTEVTDVTRTTATIICEVTDESGASVTERGVCWGTTQNPTTSGNHLSNGNGMGIYSVAITGLETGKTYYARAYAKNVNGTAYGKELSFITGDAVKPTVTTADVSNIDWRMATGGGTVVDDGDATVTERGICWSTSHDPNVSGSHVSSGTGTGGYAASMTGLTAGTTYYVRAYAKNIAGTAYGNEVSFVTKSPEKPTVTTISVTSITYLAVTGKGNVSSDGGTEIIERGVCWSVNHNPDINGSHLSSGTGTGSFTCFITQLEPETQYYVRAYATNKQGTSYGAELNYITLPSSPEGAASGLFSVSGNKQVYFSQGNLQYRASDGKWQFAENQYDVVGLDNNNISSNYNGWIDLFGWGTSGYNSKYPYMTSTTCTDYGNGTTDIANTNYDWGVYNKITNGGNQNGMWRTLTKDEWVYVFNTRSTTSGIRYAKACVNGVNGVILLPDNWNMNYYMLNNANNNEASFNENTFTILQWSTLEQYGAVFLPNAGYRKGTSAGIWGVYGCYWSASFNGATGAYCVAIDSHFNPQNSSGRDYGRSVRLVRYAQ